MSHTLFLARAALVFACSIACVRAYSEAIEPAAKSEGFSIERLNHINATLKRDVASARLPGAVLLAARNGKLVLADVVGVQDPQANIPMRRDSIFRIYSMTKPIVSVAVMMMVEEGRVLLGDPISRYIPELKDLNVGVEKMDADGTTKLDLVPANREMIVYDLLRHTAGLTYGFEGKSLVKDEYKRLNLDGAALSGGEWLSNLVKAPLQSQPGSKWEYSIAADVLGVLLERVSARTLDVYLAERLFKPLGMKDTAFWVEPAKRARIANAFAIDPVFKVSTPLTDVRQPPARFSGGGGLVSTADDYLRFAQMLLNGGELDGVRILAPNTVAFMLADQLAGIRVKLPPGAAPPGPRPGYSFGLGVAIRNELGDSITLGNAGIADWNGIAGTNFWIDPKENLAAVWMAQASGLRPYYRQLIPNMIYGAMVR